MHTTLYSATTIGINAHLVHVEVDLSYGMVQFTIVGLADTAIKESKQRISTALKNSGIRLPERKITINLAPADLKKEGTLFDLPIALGILHAAEIVQLSQEFLKSTLFLGELSLDGSIRPIKGALAIASDAHKLGKQRIILPKNNALEAGLIENIEVIGVTSIVHLISYLRGECTIIPAQTSLEDYVGISRNIIDFAQVKGQKLAKRALILAAAGRHNILFVGPPGSGKTMLAKRLATIMPKMSFEELIQATKIYSISGKLTQSQLITQRPFRSPHHTISQAGLVGGGSFPQPGEISLAHNGILFLDELTEFKRTTLEVLRQPLEHNTVSIARANQTVIFPASFLLVAALNPCPCGYLGDKHRACSCSSTTIEKYLQKLSGPLLDRIDLQIHVQSVEYDSLKPSTNNEETSLTMKQMVDKATKIQQARFNSSHMYNALMTPDMLEKYCPLTPNAEELVKKAFHRLHLSMRGYHKLLKIARTIADIDQQETIDEQHIKEAILYRSLDQTIERMKKS